MKISYHSGNTINGLSTTSLSKALNGFRFFDLAFPVSLTNILLDEKIPADFRLGTL
jgi:hypothetical protein